MFDDPISGSGAASVLEVFYRRVAEAPEALAIDAGEIQLTYSELNRRASRLAGYLVAVGIGPEIPVGVALRRSPDQIASVLAVVKAGGVYLPLDPEHPAERLATMLRESGARVLLTHRDLASAFEGAVETTLFPQEILPDANLPELETAPEISPENLLYVIFTSGSTGRPKGAAVPHRAVLALTQATGICNPGPGSRMGQISNASFDISVWELWGALLRGAALVFVEPDVVRAPPALAREIWDRQISHLAISASLFNEVVRAMPHVFARAEQILCGGERPDPAIFRRVLEEGAPKQLGNSYGPTETTAMSSWNRVTAVPAAAVSIAIGTALEGEELLIADGDLEPAAAGQEGELLIGGVGLARGYFGRPRETALAFVPHPTARRPGERVYRSGDLARWLPDGQVDFVGRRDHQVKVRGHRIELGEIEARLAEHPELDAAAVLVRGEGLEQRLVAYVRAGGKIPGRSELRQFLAQVLPEHMVPGVFVWMDFWPLNPHGKLDRSALPEPDAQRPDLETPWVAPATETEHRLAKLWSTMLGVSRVGVDDSLFELGGHSLLVTRMLSQVRELFGAEVPLDRFFADPTVRALSAWVDSEPTVLGKDDVGRGPVPGLADAKAPLSFSQQRVWFLMQLQPGNLAYQAQCYFRFRGPFVPRALQQSLQDVVGRHEIFRTSFVSEQGRPVQVIHPPPRVPLPAVDLSALPLERRQEEGQRVMARICRAVIDPGRVSLVTWILLRLEPAEHWLLHVEHHLVHDGWSFNIFLEEFAEGYRCYSRGEEPAPPEIPLHFADFAVWQHRWVESEACRQQIEYWKRQLGDRPQALALPLDHPRPPRQTFRGSSIRWQMPPSLARSVRALSRRRQTTVFVCLHSAFATLLSRYSGQLDISVGSGIANRRWLSVERLIGMLVNNVVLRCDLSGAPSFAEVLQRAHKTAREAYANQDVPFDRVVEALRPDRGSRQNPLFQAFFSFHDAPLAQVDFGEPAVDWLLGLANGSAKFDLNVTVILPEEQRLGQRGSAEDEEITFLWEHNRDLFDSSTIQRMIGHFERVVDQLSTNEHRTLEGLDLLTAGERHQIVVEGNDTETLFHQPQVLHELVEAQCRRTPQATAVVDPQEALSYAALCQRVDRLARYLGRQGVGPEIPVAISMERSVDLVVGLLGILKAGGCYVPLEPSYPLERLALLLGDLSRLAPPAPGSFKPAPPILLAHGATAGALAPLAAAGSCRLVCLDEIPAAPLGDPAGGALPAARPDQLAYIIYTSGSTGRPKGVMNSHRAITNRILWGMGAVSLSPEDCVLQKTPFSFDVSIWEFSWPLAVGASLVLAKPEGHKDPVYLAGLIAQAGITTLHFVPSMLRAFLEADGVKEACAGVRRVIASGEALEPDLVAAFEESFDADLYNHYGPTEAAVEVSRWRCRSQADVRTVPIGRPTENTQLHVLDRWGASAPLGVPGELCIGGVQVARGYVGDPRRTAESFVPDGASVMATVPATAGARLYRSGDLARVRRDGAIDFLGRWDQQVKVRGFRIELGEVEAVLAGHPAVKRCAVLVSEAGDRLVAAVELEDGAAADLRPYLTERLPEYMVPGVFHVLDALPLTASGKADRRALSSLQDLAGQRGPIETVAPRTETEELLVQIWAELIGTDRFGVLDNFFDLGGHSLHATRHMYRVQELLAITLPVRALYDAPTVEAMALLIEDRLLEEILVSSTDDAALPLA